MAHEKLREMGLSGLPWAGGGGERGFCPRGKTTAEKCLSSLELTPTLVWTAM